MIQKNKRENIKSKQPGRIMLVKTGVLLMFFLIFSIMCSGLAYASQQFSLFNNTATLTIISPSNEQSGEGLELNFTINKELSSTSYSLDNGSITNITDSRVYAGGTTSFSNIGLYGPLSYGVFANDGVRNPYTGILKIETGQGRVLEEFSKTGDAG